SQIPRDRLARVIDERNSTGHSIRAVFGNLDTGRARRIDLLARLTAVERETEGTRWTCPHGANDVIHPPAARRHERNLTHMKHVPPAGGRKTGSARAFGVSQKSCLPSLIFFLDARPPASFPSHRQTKSGGGSRQKRFSVWAPRPATPPLSGEPGALG